MRRRFPALPIVFACTTRDLDRRELSRYAFEAIPLDTPRWSGISLQLPAFFLSFFRTWADAYRLVRRLRPAVVIGVGGYGCALPVYAASRLRIPSVVLEQNVVPGRTTRFLCAFAERICCQWREAIGSLQKGIGNHLRRAVSRRRTSHRADEWLVHTGNPIRAELKPMPLRSARGSFGMEQARRVMLVLGGSQGSSWIDAMAPQVAAIVSKVLPGFGVIHLASERQREKVAGEYRNAGVQASVHGFFHDMRAAYSAADFALCRAGGTTIAELAIYGLPMILIPYPHATDDHQRANARAVESAGAGFMAVETDLDVARLAQIVMKVATDTRCLMYMSASARRLGKPEAAAAVANILTELGGY